MRKKKTNKNFEVNLTLPAVISNFTQDDENEKFSRAKLRVFHSGETVDHRFFTPKCREQLVKSLAYTPIVSYYDKDKDDFVGHATEQQILGIVDPCREYTYETDENGVEWCVCDVVLYTERPDMVGKIAQKIVGHSQSLELDPDSVKYDILYDDKKHFKRIEFTSANFIGLSVLGNDQKPAFSGSAFFNYDEKFENKMRLLKEYCENNEFEGGAQHKMDYIQFMQLSFGETFEKLNNALSRVYDSNGYNVIRDIFSDNVVFDVYMRTGDRKILRVNYSIAEDGSIILDENVEEVRVTYTPIVVSNAAETSTPAFENEKDEEVATAAEVKGEEEVKDDEVNASETSDDDETSLKRKDDEGKCASEKVDENSYEVAEAAETTETTEITEVAEVTATALSSTINEESTCAIIEKGESANEQEAKEESDFAALSSSERAEFEALKKEKKVNLLNSYKEFLSEEDYNTFSSNIDNYTTKDLEYELLKKYKANSAALLKEKATRAFAYDPILNHTNNDDRDPIADYIAKSKINR